jgi:O-antigen/teichoic acid export membrane protein
MRKINLKQKLLNGSSFRKDVLWTLITQMLVMLSAFGITKTACNILTVDEFGLYNVVRRSVSVISFVMLSGMGITLPRYLAIYQGAHQYRKMVDLTCCSLFFVGVICVILATFALLFSEAFIENVTGNSDSTLYWLAMAFAFSTSISALLIAYYRGVNDFKNYSIAQVSFQLLLLLSLLFIPRHNVNAVFLLWFLTTFSFTVLYFIYENHRNRNIIFRAYRSCYFWDMMKTIAVYSTPRLIGDFLLFSFSAFPVLYLSQVMSMTDVAYYSVGLTIINMVTPFFSFLGVVLLPYVSGAMSNGRFSEAQRLIRRLSVWYISLAAVLTVLFGLFLPVLIKLFFSPDYVVCKDIAMILLLSVLPQSMYLLYRNPIDAVSTLPYNTLILLVSCIVLIILFSFSSSLSDYSYSFVCASFVQGGLSILVWLLLNKKKGLNGVL